MKATWTGVIGIATACFAAVACASGADTPGGTGESTIAGATGGASAASATGAGPGGATASTGSGGGATSGAGTGGGGGFTGSGPDNAYCALGDVANFGTTDGPAALPQACIYTALSGTPSPGQTIAVPAGGSVNGALASASCGDTIALQAGATFAPFQLPAKSCDAGHWITIRPSTPDSGLPPEGSRVTPCYAGVASLPGRPAYPCASATKALAQVVTSAANAPAITVAPGANHYRLIGLEVTQSPGVPIYNRLLALAQSDHVIVDRCWVHGTPADLTQSGISVAGTYMAVIDSYVNDLKCPYPGACVDSQAINGGTGTNPQGPIKIVDNFLEAAGESFIFGGGAATKVPTDFEVRRNHSFKPLIWRMDDPSYFGHEFVVKNLGEFKNGSSILVEGNVFENTWVGQSDQFGFAVLLTPKNPNDTCPVCVTNDLTFRHNLVRHANYGMQIASAPASQGGTSALGIHRVSVHDNLFDDINAPKWEKQGSGGCCQGGTGIQLSNGNSLPGTVTSAITFDHNTFLLTGTGGGGYFIKENDAVASNGALIQGFVVQNNVSPAGLQGSISPNGGNNIVGAVNVLAQINGTTWTFTENLLPTSVFALEHANAPYPASNQTCGSNTATCAPNDFTGIFVNYGGGDGGDYHLEPGSPYKNAGTDGRDLGADIDAIEASISGVL